MSQSFGGVENQPSFKQKAKSTHIGNCQYPPSRPAQKFTDLLVLPSDKQLCLDNELSVGNQHCIVDKTPEGTTNAMYFGINKGNTIQTATEILLQLNYACKGYSIFSFTHFMYLALKLRYIAVSK